MSKAKLPLDAFEFYFGLGPDRSVSAVAEHFAVNKKTVMRRAETEKWSERVEARDRQIRELVDARVAETLADIGVRQAQRSSEMHDAIAEVITPARVKALFGVLFKTAVQKEDVAAARFLIERTLGKSRTESTPAFSIDLPNGLESTTDVRRAANALLKRVTEGQIAPEDAQRTAAVLEAARKSIETEDLEKRIAAIEENLKKERGS